MSARSWRRGACRPRGPAWRAMRSSRVARIGRWGCLPCMTSARQRLSRAAFLSRGTLAGVALTVGGSALGALTPEAAADTLPDDDLAYMRLLVGAELLAIDFYTRAIATNRVREPALLNMRHAL